MPNETPEQAKRDGELADKIAAQFAIFARQQIVREPEYVIATLISDHLSAERLVHETRVKELEAERDYWMAEQKKEHDEVVRWMVKASEWCEDYQKQLATLKQQLKSNETSMKGMG